MILGIVVPGLCLGWGVLAIASLVRSRTSVRIAVVSAYAIMFYVLTFDNIPIVTHATIVPMP
jgi:hypothetical protein